MLKLCADLVTFYCLIDFFKFGWILIFNMLVIKKLIFNDDFQGATPKYAT